MLDYRQLASAALVCKSWSNRCGQTDLWQQLYVKRWGEGKSACCNSSKFRSWKAAYEAQDRSERIGMDMTITREGFDYLIVHKGEILRFLGSCKSESSQEEHGDMLCKSKTMAPIFADRGTEPPCLSSKEEIILGTRMKHASSQGLLDKIIFFLGDLDYAMRKPKRNRRY